MHLTPDILAELKKPFGTLIPDAQVTKERVLGEIKGAPKMVAVGDATTERLISFGMTPDVSVVDGQERRGRRSPPSFQAKELKCRNPAGTISKAAVQVLKKALSAKGPVRVLVDGEEDLLALPVFAMAPDGSAVLYGQPLEGLVVVRVDAEKRKKAKDLMDRIGLQD